ncbi:MAG: ABC1 kinase family protein [Chloroflexota bacterium]
MPTVLQGIRHLRRYRQAVGVLTKYGFGYLLDQLGWRGFRPLRRIARPEVLDASPPERIRMVVEELGPTAIKMGQMFSTRGDVIPAEIIHELEKLVDTVPAAPFSAIVQQVESELKKPLTELYATFEPQPLASASLGQVHAATLHSGESVAVKVLRPGVERLIATDLDILLEAAALAQRRTAWGEYYDVLSLAHEYADTLLEELNYEQEGHNMDRFRENFSQEKYVHVPGVHWELTTRRVLTMERVRGVKISDLATLQAEGLNCRRVARNNIKIVLRAILKDGFFHADPHAGNFFVQPDESIALLDFGIMGQLQPKDREGVVLLFVGLFRQETDRVLDALSMLDIASRMADRRKLARDLDRLRVRYFGQPLENIRARSFFEDLMGLAFANKLRLPGNLVLLFKTVAMLEGLSLQLDPSINVFTEVEPFVRDAMIEMQSPLAWGRRLFQTLNDSGQAVLFIPHQISNLLDKAADGEFTLRMRHEELEGPLRRFNDATNRLALVILVATFVLGPALLIPNIEFIPAGWRTWAMLLIMGGFALSFLLAFYVLIAILLSRRQ